MRYRKLGRTDFEVSVIGIGSWALADPRIWGPQDEAEAIATLRAALDADVNLIDTSEGYGQGRSEEIVGKALEGRRDRAVLCTKVLPEHHRCEDLLRACEESLRRLRTDRIDLYLLHWPSHEIGFEEPVRALETLERQGKVRATGVSNFAVRDLGDILSLGRVEANQLPYNLLWRVIEREVAPRCLEHDVSVLCYSPLLHGVLTGAYATADDVPPGQARTAHFSKHRPMAPHDTDGAEDLTFATLDAIRDIARASGRSMAELALAWLLERPGVASAIVGARSPAEAEADARTADVRLEASTLAALDDATDALARHFGTDPDPWRIPGRMR